MAKIKVRDCIDDLSCYCDRAPDKSGLRQDVFDLEERLRCTDSHSDDKSLAAGAGGIASAPRRLRATHTRFQLSVLFCVAIRVSFSHLS